MSLLSDSKFIQLNRNFARQIFPSDLLFTSPFLLYYTHEDQLWGKFAKCGSATVQQGNCQRYVSLLSETTTV